MRATSDLDAYLSRIGYGGSTKPDLATLGGLLALQEKIVAALRRLVRCPEIEAIRVPSAPEWR